MQIRKTKSQIKSSKKHLSSLLPSMESSKAEAKSGPTPAVNPEPRISSSGSSNLPQTQVGCGSAAFPTNPLAYWWRKQGSQFPLLLPQPWTVACPEYLRTGSISAANAHAASFFFALISLCRPSSSSSTTLASARLEVCRYIFLEYHFFFCKIFEPK